MDSQLLREQAAKIIGGWVDFFELTKRVLKDSPFWLKVSGQFAGSQLEKRDDELILLGFNKIYASTDPQYHDDLDAVLRAIVKKDLVGLRGSITGRLVAAIKTPAGDVVEGIVIKHQVNMLIELSEYFLQQEDLFASTDPGDGPNEPHPDDDEG